jgi:hypothetical protein
MSEQTSFEKSQAQTHEHGETTRYKIAPIAEKRGHMHHPRQMTGKHPDEQKQEMHEEKGGEAEAETQKPQQKEEETKNQNDLSL